MHISEHNSGDDAAGTQCVIVSTQTLKGRVQLSRCNGAAGIDQPIWRRIALLTVRQRTHEDSGSTIQPARVWTLGYVSFSGD